MYKSIIIGSTDLISDNFHRFFNLLFTVISDCVKYNTNIMTFKFT